MKPKEIHKDRTLPPKFVKKANMWSTTSFEKGKQVQVWTLDKPEKHE